MTSKKIAYSHPALRRKSVLIQYCSCAIYYNPRSLERVRMDSRPLWLIVKQRCSGLEVFTIDRHMLPVFSSREEVEAFLHFRGASNGWLARETTCGELVSILYGPCRDVEDISLDPLTQTVEPTSCSRKAFVEALLADDASSSFEEPHMLVGVAS